MVHFIKIIAIIYGPALYIRVQSEPHISSPEFKLGVKLGEHEKGFDTRLEMQTKLINSMKI